MKRFFSGRTRTNTQFNMVDRLIWIFVWILIVIINYGKLKEFNNLLIKLKNLYKELYFTIFLACHNYNNNKQLTTHRFKLAARPYWTEYLFGFCPRKNQCARSMSNFFPTRIDLIFFKCKKMKENRIKRNRLFSCECI